MFYLLPNMPPILENNGADEVSIAMVEFEKKKSLARYSRYGSTIPDDKGNKDKLATTLIKNSDLVKTDKEETNNDYDDLSKRMQCAKRIQYAAGFVTLITILIVLIVTTIQSGHTPSLAPHAPQHGQDTKITDIGFRLKEDNNNIEQNDQINDLVIEPAIDMVKQEEEAKDEAVKEDEIEEKAEEEDVDEAIVEEVDDIDEEAIDEDNVQKED